MACGSRAGGGCPREIRKAKLARGRPRRRLKRQAASAVPPQRVWQDRARQARLPWKAARSAPARAWWPGPPLRRLRQ
eukprot:7943572-Alexandrium_andersonii.AAC.1